MELCVPEDFKNDALNLISRPGFFANLPPMKGAIKAVKEMESEGLNLLIVTAPLKGLVGRNCMQDKVAWVEKHLGESWVDKVIFCQDKVITCFYRK